jgi:uncharacterized protein YbbC (DUF1343 family)
MQNGGWQNGIDKLLLDGGKKLRGKRIGLIAHPASVDAGGCPTATRLMGLPGVKLAALFSPEHGFFGIAGAGDHVVSVRHPSWNIPVHSLYGQTRRPTAEMLAGLDAVIYDLQDLSIRCYTYVSTLRYVMEEAAQCGVAVIVTDRTNPLAGMVDGPMLESDFESFVGCFPGPLVYGLTSGEAARWLKKSLKLDVDLQVVPSSGLRRVAAFSSHRWISPSPSIRYVRTAWCYPITVGFEALPAIDHGRQTLMPFELIGAPAIDEKKLAALLLKEKLPGLVFHPVVYENAGKIYNGVRVVVTDPTAYRPVATAVAILSVLQKMIGQNKLWNTKGSRPEFFDQLFGTDSVRKAIQSGKSLKSLSRNWKPSIERWKLNVGC